MKALNTRCFKELIMKKIIFYVSLFAFTIFLTSCFDPIYPRIRNEVELEKATKTGYINSLVRYQDKIYMSNGSVFYKSTSDSVQQYGAWNRDESAPTISYNTSDDSFSGVHIIKLAADTASLYALGVEFSTDKGETRPSGKALYRTDGGVWNRIWRTNAGSNDDGYTNDNITIFCTNSINPTNRRAYLRWGTDVYELNPSGTGISGVGNKVTFDNTNYVKKSSSYPDYPNSAVAVDTGKTWFFSGLASGSNEIQTSPTTYQDATYIYWSNASAIDGGAIAYSSTIHYSKSDGTGSGSIGASYPAYSMAVNSNSIILGTYTGGIYRASLSGGVPTGVESIDNVDGADSLGSPYIITSLLSLHPEKAERDNVIYAGVAFRGTEASIGASTSNVCLWSYYPARGNWNRE